MKVVDIARSLFNVPVVYDDVRFHHCAFGYAMARYFFSSNIFKKLSEGVLGVISGLSESFIPLIQVGLVPDFMIRWGIRLQLQ